MKIINVLVFALILLFSSSAIGQVGLIDPDDRFGTLLNFESGDTLVATTGDTLSALTVFQFVNIFEKVPNPAPNEINDSENVAKITTNDGTLPFVFVDNEYILDFSVRHQIQIDVYSPEAGRSVQFVIEKFSDFTINVPVVATTTVANEWETLTFDFSGAALDTYGRIVLYMDFGGTDVGDIWYFDNVVKNRPPIPYDDGILADFDNNPAYWFSYAVDIVPDYTQGLTVIENPFKTGINTSETVASFITTDQLVFDGAVVVERYVPFDFSEGAVFKLKVYAPGAGLNCLFQLEHFDDAGQTLGRVFVVTSTTLIFEWEELTFDFANTEKSLEPGFYSKIVVMPDFVGTSHDEEWLFDDIVFEGKLTTSVSSSNLSSNPVEFTLHQNYPNPFNPATRISFNIQQSSKVQLRIFNLLGQAVITLVDENRGPGEYFEIWQGQDRFARQVPSGIYVYQLQAGGFVASKKMVLLK